MPKKLQRSLQDYLSKIKKPNRTPSIQLPHSSISASKSCILSGCKHPKTQSFAIDGGRNGVGSSGGGGGGGNDAATLDDIDRFLFENFKSLYLRDDDGGVGVGVGVGAVTCKKGNGNNEKECGGGDQFLFESPRFVDPPANLCGSNRFFVAPGSSSSLMEEARISLTMSEDVTSSSTSTATNTTSSTTTTTITDVTTGSSDNSRENETKATLPDDCVAVLTHSTSPYDDFKRSMQEMVEARLQGHAKVDWEFMEELLFCYLNLNEKKSHKYILSAFVDLMVVLRRNRGGGSGGTPARSRDKVGRNKVRRDG
ncbi:transcription repressor OFP14 [Eucalyptus grandis]|uniref:transcription repressor OFP14 n=1 Tax=Eucalyptus grandis TaxID=71139 RepID=UPI00192EEA37|nr:transcription repressor OFP14 [Eucalyptus grandis]